MHRLSFLTAGLLALALAGCSSEPLRRVDALTSSPKPLQHPIEQARDALAGAPTCCSGIDQLPYQPLEAGFTGDVLIDTQAPAYRFETGKSFFRAFALPAGGPSFEIRIYSQAGSSVLAPNAMLLDSRMRPTRLLDADDFSYVPPTGLKGDSLDARIRIDRSQPEHPGNERYLILYTSDAQMAGQTVLQHPAKAYAKAAGNEPPSIPDPVAKHSPVGVIRLVMIPDSAAGSTAKGYVPGYSIGQEMGNELPSAPAPAVLPETSAYYRQAIDAALAQKDLERALRLADEAARVGDTQAKQHLLQRIEIR
ncbi:MalM family protein [Stutzerimonas stutzeri]|uniref:Maltose operon periplasmic protein (MalM) n=1 Tax=Stutzerimonas stutzeri RCH2 TaxID=644801 RepID=L0GHH5_STUST|nr:MalM family protein [Stutzerimonas stutzeri]AGA85451.1 Maltose operon periplasmic protein precursor (MalM) [Stutzerimonas stutzeri RCH2]